jgi:hypothetical protein
LIEYTNSGDINHRSIEYQEKTSTPNAVRIDSVTSKLVEQKNDESHINCRECKSIIALDGTDLLDVQGKRHFCRGAERIAHEERRVAEIQEIIEYYNRRELSSFQVELNIP